MRAVAPAMLEAGHGRIVSMSSLNAHSGGVTAAVSRFAYAAAALHHYVFHVIPMANPDGVHNGLGALTAPLATSSLKASPAFIRSP
mgnify:CR=1 FL=1